MSATTVCYSPRLAGARERFVDTGRTICRSILLAADCCRRVGFDVTTNGAEITFEVEGWPPTKGEAKSMLAAGHSQAERVRLLLQAAGHAAEHQRWVTTAGPAMPVSPRPGGNRKPSAAISAAAGRSPRR